MLDNLPVPKRKPYEHALNSVKAILSTLPFTGGIASIIDDYVPKSIEMGVQQAIEFLNKKLETLDERCSQMPNPDEFSETFKSFMIIAQRSTRNEKLRAAAGILANALLKKDDEQKLSYTELDHFARAVESLSAGAISVLGTICKLARSGSRRPSSYGGYRITAGEIVPHLKGLGPQLALSLMCELGGWNLLIVQQPGATVGADYATNTPVTLTAMGMKFVDYVVNLGESAPHTAGDS